MHSLKLTYDGYQHATAVKEPGHNTVAIDCPFTGKGNEFSPASLLGISLASCMPLSMGAIAQRDQMDLNGTVVDVKFTGMDQTFPQVETIELIFDIPRDFSARNRKKLETAAHLCPIMASFRDEITITAIYRYAVADAA